MSPVTSTDVQRTAAQAGPFPGVGVGVGVGLGGVDDGVPCDCADAVAPAFAVPAASPSGRASTPQELSVAATTNESRPAATRAGRERCGVPMATSYGPDRPNTRRGPLRTATKHESVV